MSVMDRSSPKEPDLLLEVLRDDAGRYSLRETPFIKQPEDRPDGLINNPNEAEFYDAVESRKKELEEVLGVIIDFRDLPASEA